MGIIIMLLGTRQSTSRYNGVGAAVICTIHHLHPLRNQTPHVTTQECHKILQRQDSYHTNVKALKYLEFTQDTIGHQKVMEKLSAPRIKYQTTRMMREAQDTHNNGCQSVLRDRHYDYLV